MTVLKSEIRHGAYYDSIVLMQLQSALAGLDGIADSGVVMATEANLALLESNGMKTEEAAAAGPDDLVIVVQGESADATAAALGQIDELLARRRSTSTGEYRPRSLEAACKMLPDADWVLVSVPGRYAARVADEALERGRNVFLYSDNVALADEVALKKKAREKDLLVMGPDCGTALVGGLGLGFANRVRRGPIGVVGASGTGIQAVTSRVHALGSGISHALGTGGRDLHDEVGAVTAYQALDLLSRDRDTEVIVLVSKPPSPRVAAGLLAAARAAGKPVVVDFLGYPPPARRLGPLHFAASLDEAAALAVELVDTEVSVAADQPDAKSGYLRGLFSGGTLAYEAVQGLRSFLAPLCSNVAVDGVEALADPATSRDHTIVDLGADELTVGRLHPMIDPDLCLRRLRQEAADPDVGVILLDVVLGYGAAADPAGRLAPVIAEVRGERPDLDVAAVVVGTDEDPQGLDEQIERLRDAGVLVFDCVPAAVDYVCARLPMSLLPSLPGRGVGLGGPIAAINAGLESFYDSLIAQGAAAVQMDWRPPAGGNEKLMAILEKMKKK